MIDTSCHGRLYRSRMSLRRESEDGEDEDEDEEEDEAVEAVRFLGVNVEGLVVMASYVGRRSIVLVSIEGSLLNVGRESWCMITGCLRMVFLIQYIWNGSTSGSRDEGICRQRYKDTPSNMKQRHN